MALAAAMALPVRAQLPFAAAKSSGQTVTPVFEGWYRNPDGTFSISFGYFNRNTEEVDRDPGWAGQLHRAGRPESGSADASSSRGATGVCSR